MKVMMILKRASIVLYQMKAVGLELFNYGLYLSD